MTDEATRNPGQQAKPGQQNQRDAAGTQHQQPNPRQGKPGEQNQKTPMGGSRDPQSGGQSRGGLADQNTRSGEHGRG